MNNINNVKLNEEQAEYVSKFYNPEFSAHDFVLLFSAINASQKIFSFDRDSLVSFIQKCKANSTFERILREINLENNGIFYYSFEFNEAIAQAKWARLLYTISPETDSTIYIQENFPVKEFTQKKVEYLNEMTSFIIEYNESLEKKEPTPETPLLLEKKNNVNN